VTEDDIPESSETVDVFLAIGVHQHRAVAADPHTTGALNRRIVLWMNQRCEITGQPFGHSGVDSIHACTILRSTRHLPLKVTTQRRIMQPTHPQ
jgi:hypothetical protein